MPEAIPTEGHFRVSPRVLGPLGAEQLQDPALAVLELVKNSWDADATRVSIEVTRAGTPSIAVIDNGHGMDRQDFVDRWLVIGTSHKRGVTQPIGSRPLIGEKGLGRLASFSLGRTLSIESARENKPGFSARLDWQRLLNAKSLEDYKIPLAPKRRPVGTRVEIRNLRTKWSDENTAFLVTHAQFLTSVPGQRFVVSLTVDGAKQRLKDPVSTIAQLAEAYLEMAVSANGAPIITSCVVSGVDETDIPFRPLKQTLCDRRLAGTRLTMRFFRRDQAQKRLSDVLPANDIADALERFQGIRVYRGGINVPPYGLAGNDWASLEKQRTATGGPTMVPGNSQLTGELHIPTKAVHLVVTAGRSGFADQTAVTSLAKYVQWAARELGTARRAHALGLSGRKAIVPGRVDVAKKGVDATPEAAARAALKDVAVTQSVKSDPELRQKLREASEAVTAVLDRQEETLRLYAQLASTGIAATGFAHELRAEFDVVSDAIDELKSGSGRPDRELVELLNESWGRIKAFAALFKVVPVKLRRQRQRMTRADIKRSVTAISGLASPDKVQVEVVVPDLKLAIVPAELDSVLLNLVSNAIKAIAESDNASDGRIKINFIADAVDLMVRVADNGCGVSQKVASIMFEPLEGKFADGTGMGLPIVKFIAERYKGHVTLSAMPPKGYSTEMLVSFRDVVR